VAKFHHSKASIGEGMSDQEASQEDGAFRSESRTNTTAVSPSPYVAAENSMLAGKILTWFALARMGINPINIAAIDARTANFKPNSRFTTPPR